MKRESLFLDVIGLIAEIVGLGALFLVMYISVLNHSGRFLSYHYSESCQFAFILLSLFGLAYFGEAKIRRNEFISLLFRILYYIPFILILPIIILMGLFWYGGNVMGWYFCPPSAVAAATFLLTLISDIARIGHGYDKMVEQINKESMRGEKKLNWLPLLAEFACFGLLCFASSGTLFRLDAFVEVSTRPIFFYAAVFGSLLFVPFFIIRIKSRGKASLLVRLISYLPPLACLVFAIICLSQNLANASSAAMPFFLSLLLLSPICLIAMLAIDLSRLGGRRKAVVAFE